MSFTIYWQLHTPKFALNEKFPIIQLSEVRKYILFLLLWPSEAAVPNQKGGSVNVDNLHNPIPDMGVLRTGLYLWKKVIFLGESEAGIKRNEKRASICYAKGTYRGIWGK